MWHSRQALALAAVPVLILTLGRSASGQGAGEAEGGDDAGGAAAADGTDGIDVVVVEVRFPREAVSGLPLPVQFVVHGEASVVAPRLLDDTNPFLFEMRSDEAAYEFPPQRRREVPSGRGRYHGAFPKTYRIPQTPTRVEAGRKCEFVLDVSHLASFMLLDEEEGRTEEGQAKGGEEKFRGEQKRRPSRRSRRAADIAPGLYRVEFLEPGFRFECARDTVRVLDPNADEKRLLENLAAMAEKAPRWRLFAERYERATEGVDMSRISEAGRRQLEYHALLARLARSKRPIAELELPPSDGRKPLPGYANELRVLHYEIALAGGSKEDTRKTREAILAERPHERALLDYIRDRQGTIARYRSVAGRDRRKPGPRGAGKSE